MCSVNMLKSSDLSLYCMFRTHYAEDWSPSQWITEVVPLKVESVSPNEVPLQVTIDDVIVLKVYCVVLHLFLYNVTY